ncbi:MAG: hypothetical protein ABFD14_01520 [Anaerolineaceae bacterium]
MNNSTKIRSLGVTLLLLGIILATLVNVALTSPNFEAYYHFIEKSRIDHEILTTLECPRVVGASEHAVFQVKLHNASDKTMTTNIETSFARAINDYEERVAVEIPAGETKIYTWQATSEDIIFKRMVLTSFFVFSAIDYPNHYGTCAVLMLPWNVNGEFFLYICIVISLLFIGAGLWLWIRTIDTTNNRRLFILRGIFVLCGIVVIGMLASFFGSWLIGEIALMLTALLGIVLSAYILQGV